jgi:hypothetical protein
MSVHELTSDQRTELKLFMLEDVLGEQPSWGDLADVDNIVSDERMMEEYEGVCFTDEDFFCSCS